MVKTIFELLEKTEAKYPNKIAFTDSKREITFKEFVKSSKVVGTNISEYDWFNKPIAIFLDKNIDCLISMMGINYSGNFYTVIDNKMPIERVKAIFKTLKPVCIITDTKNSSKLKSIKTKLILIDKIDNQINQTKLDFIKRKIIDTNPMYILFTSGSTGIPKGAVLSHKAVIAYTNWFKDTMGITDQTIFGSQTPFYFSMSVSDIFATMLSGATFHIIPKMLFSFPIKLIEFLNEKKVNTIYWVPSALCIIANFQALDVILPKYLKKVLFAGEVMPMKQLNIWRKHLPDIMYANLFGPTETTDICSYYIVDRNFLDSETLPIGKNCDNCDLLIIKDDNTLAKVNEEGELFVRGSFLSSGYYNNAKKTKEVFVKNPLNKAFPEIVYKTGDIVKQNERGELIYLNRKDFQIKHMGFRIELGEIESAINVIDGIETCVCIYDDETDKIVLFYKGQAIEKEEVLKQAKIKLPQYMLPNEIIKITKIPYNANGKIDRKQLKNNYKGVK